MKTAEATAKALVEKFASKAQSPVEFRGEWTVKVSKEIIGDVARWMKESQGYLYLVDLTGVDYMGEDERLEVVYEFYHYTDKIWLRVKTRTKDEIPSIAGIYSTAEWHEREAYDLVGVKFSGHPDLRRILMWEGYPYHPLQKDFPLEGRESSADQAFSAVAPMEGGPFLTTSAQGSVRREPRSRAPKL